MQPLRLIILLGLFYILFRLLTGPRKKRVRPTGRPAGGTPVAHDILVEDPVCHTYIPKGQAVMLEQGGSSHYFCSAKCRETFLADKGGNA